MNKLEQLTRIIMEYNAGNAQCISCFIKVYCFARLIVRAGYLDEYQQFILNCVDIPHDFEPCMEKYGHCTGDSQEKGGRSMPASCLRHLNCRRKIFSGFVHNLPYADIGKAVADALNGVFSTVSFSEIGDTLATGLNGAFTTLYNFAVNFNWKQMVDNIAGGINI